MTVVDLHAHHLPARLGDRFTELSGARFPLRHSDDQSRRIADLDTAGVDVQVLGLGAVQPYWPDRAAAVAGAGFANDLYAETAAASAGRLRAFGAVPLPHPDEAAAEAVRCLDELGFDGIGLGCSAAGLPLDDPRFDPLWAELDARGAIAYLHPGVANTGLVGVEEYPFLLGPVFGSPAEQAVAVARLALKGTLARFPNVRWVVCGMGGSLLVSRSKLADSLERGRRHAESHDPDTILALLRDRVWYDTSAIDAVLTLAARQAGVVDRLVLGSDAPWGSATRTLAAMRDHLSPAEVAGVLARGAQVMASSAMGG
ncbi:amidohydrolase family protein [Actinoplanes couchii]|uniref:Amidohydrolase n=1 Tax=Actinoplanes couchii TaxID=403638 RepID=A0ABQ3XP65_9ACTN|nr:amidohydrolase family protein [Actinoplanes couchii]MDR6318608.1 aminocarboxymuconate-semialdehyde decarboxylase [Actinoplanes couchii]GID60217.1 amidohydrolase [Actinoplanes couchii]